MVEGIVGLPGSGKTYLLAKIGIEDIKKGKEVYANFHLEGARYFSRLPQVIDIIKYKLVNKQPVKMTILIDEINLSFPSRMWQKIPGWVLYFWSQTRKFGLDIYYTSQSLARVDKVIREISNFVWVVKPLPFGIFMASKILPEEYDKTKKDIYERKFFLLEKKYFSKYDTYEILELQEEFLK